MRFLGVRLAIVLLAVLLPGCPFESKVPLGAPQRRDVEGRLTGYWVWEDPKGKEESTLVAVLPFNDAEYFVELMEGDKPPGRFRAFQVEIDGQVFWNVNGVAASFPPKSYFFARCTLQDDGRLTIMCVGEKGVPKALASDADGLMAFLKSRLTDPSLDDEDGAHVWRRPLPGEVEKGRLRSGVKRPVPEQKRSDR